jgi:hypothetical protein
MPDAVEKPADGSKRSKGPPDLRRDQTEENAHCRSQADQRINDRGVRIDRDLVLAAQKIVDVGLARVNEEITELTLGEVTSVRNNAGLREWLGTRGSRPTASRSKA